MGGARTDDEQTALVESVLRAALTSLAPEQLPRGVLMSGLLAVVADQLARACIYTHESPAQWERRAKDVIAQLGHEVLRRVRYVRDKLTPGE